VTAWTLAAPQLTRAAARALADAAQAEAGRRGLAVAVAVVDAGGHPILLDRMDGTATCAAPLALSKAETAAATLAPTDAWFASTQPGQPDWGMHVALGGRLCAMPGGLPVEAGGAVAGAVGVSGGSAEEDLACARVALAALGTP
jgi:uncharacterized protein GlcG (DUF336 family)